MQKNTTKKGFTLIELLIVIAIIGILAVALLPSVTGAPARARDAQRQADLNVIITALELYNSDKGHYPKDVDTCVDQLQDDGTTPDILKGYMKVNITPKDPQPDIQAPGSNHTGCYVYTVGDGNPVHYVLGAAMESPENFNAVTFPTAKVSSAPVIKKGQQGATHFEIVQ